MAKLSNKPCRPEAPAPDAEPARRVASRRKAADQRLRILERLTSGLSVAHIARVEKLTVRREQQIIAAMLESREIDPPAGFVQLQVHRLSAAMIVSHTMMMEGDLQAVDRMIRLTRELDGYHGFPQAPAPPEPPPPRRLAAPARQPQLTNSAGRRPMRNFPPCNPLKSPNTAKESRKPRRRRRSRRGGLAPLSRACFRRVVQVNSAGREGCDSK
jgi:hypothetical protein